MSIKEEQIQRELEAIRYVIKSSQERMETVNKLKEIFIDEITTLASAIDGWKTKTSDPNADELAFTELLNNVDSDVLSEVIIRALFEGHMIAESRPTFQFIVDRILIQRSLKAILPVEERAVPIQHKFKIVDRYVTRAVLLLPHVFKIESSTTRNAKGQQMITYFVTLTPQASVRLGEVPPLHVIKDSPMLCKPQPWTSVFEGGFLTTEAQRGSPLVQSKRLSYKNLRDVDRHLQTHQLAIKAVNTMQNVGFRLDPNYQKYQDILAKNRKAKIVDCDRKIQEYAKRITLLKNQLKSSGLPIESS